VPYVGCRGPPKAGFFHDKRRPDRRAERAAPELRKPTSLRSLTLTCIVPNNPAIPVRTSTPGADFLLSRPRPPSKRDTGGGREERS